MSGSGIVRRKARLTHTVWLVSVLAGLMALPAVAVDERATHLIELAVAYGDSHFDPAAKLVYEPSGERNIAEHSLAYAVALLEKDIGIPRARSVVEAVLAAQDTTPNSPTRGQFRWYAGRGYSARALYLLAPLLARLHTRHAATLGPAIATRLREAMELGLRAAQRPEPKADVSDELARYAALAQLGNALGEPAWAGRAAGVVAQWVRGLAQNGRDWTPSPSGDAMRLLSLQRIWEAIPGASRRPIDEALGLCYWDLAQRLDIRTGITVGAASPLYSSEYLFSQSVVQYLTYRDFGIRLPLWTQPLAVSFALCEYRPPHDVVAFVARRGAGDPYVVQTNSVVQRQPEHTYCYVHPSYTLGTMTGWCLPESAPVLMTFARDEEQPAGWFFVHGAPAHLSSFQYGNFAICSFNFDRVGKAPRRQAWVRGTLGTARQIEQVWAIDSEWNGEPIAVGARNSIAIKRAGTYVVITVLESVPTQPQPTLRPKPAVLEWQNVGEMAALTLTVYARQEDYELRRTVDDLRAGFIIQIWDGDQFDSLRDLMRWLEGPNTRALLTQKHATAQTKVRLPEPPTRLSDQYLPRPKPRYETVSQKLHTIEYAFNKGNGNRFELVEDLRRNRVVSRKINGQPVPEGLLWQGPAFTWKSGQTLEAALAAPPPLNPTDTGG